MHQVVSAGLKTGPHTAETHIRHEEAVKAARGIIVNVAATCIRRMEEGGRRKDSPVCLSHGGGTVPGFPASGERMLPRAVPQAGQITEDLCPYATKHRGRSGTLSLM